MSPLFISKSLILVASIPPIHEDYYEGSRALPSLTGQGAYLQYKEFFYELSCDTYSCNWMLMEQRLSKAVYAAVMMYLPPGFARENC